MRSLLSVVTESKFMQHPAYYWKWVCCEKILSCKDVTVVIFQGMSGQFPSWQWNFGNGRERDTTSSYKMMD